MKFSQIYFFHLSFLLLFTIFMFHTFFSSCLSYYKFFLYSYVFLHIYNFFLFYLVFYLFFPTSPSLLLSQLLIILLYYFYNIISCKNKRFKMQTFFKYFSSILHEETFFTFFLVLYYCHISLKDILLLKETLHYII